jgi:cellulose synthase/poly-beta-1,6-N-acetylglucosamine synthase-like glycosyltransferase
VIRSGAVDTAIEAVRTAIGGTMDVLAVPLIVYFAVLNSALLALVVLAFAAFRSQQRRRATALEWQDGGLSPGVSLLVPAHNEEVGIVTAVTSFLTLRYPRHEVVVVDDGSTDGTFSRLRDAFDLVPVPRVLPPEVPVRARVLGVHVPRDGRTRLVVVRKENSGRSEAINVAINAATEPLVAMIDGDSILEPDGLLRVARPFVDDPTRMVATGGAIRPVNGSRVEAGRIVRVEMPRTWLVRMQVVEYLRAFLLGRTGWSRLGALVLISGAFGLFRRDVVVAAGGLDPDSIGEDFELVLRIHRQMRDEARDYRVEFVPEPVLWTEVPSSVGVLRSQRRRWHRGLWATLWAYRGMLLHPRYGRIGVLALPYYWLFELAAPLIELFGLVFVPLGLVLGVVDVGHAALFLVLAYAYSALVTLAALLVDEWAFHRHDRWRAIWITILASALENIGYRQLTVWWRLEVWWASLRRRSHVWGVMTRTGFDESRP